MPSVVFISWGEYVGRRDAIKCAKAFCGWELHSIENETGYLAKIIDANGGHAWEAYGIARWLVLRDYAKKHGLQFPIFCPDWDVLIMRDLNESYAPFLQYDYTVSIGHTDEGTAVSSAAYGVNNWATLELFCEGIEQLISDSDPFLKGMNDMDAWRFFYAARSDLKRGNLYEIQADNSVFDHHMQEPDQGRYCMDGILSKQLIWKDRRPYFRIASSGELIRANTIHAWGVYKTKTAEMARKAGL